MAERQQVRGNRAQLHSQLAERQQARANRINQIQGRMVARQQAQVNRGNRQNMMAERQQLRALKTAQVQDRLVMRNNARFDRLDRARAFAPVPATLSIERTRFIPVGQATQFIGAPIATVNNIVPLAAFPAGFSYLYPDTPNYYYQYGGGYAYQIDRTSNLIAALLPLLGGGFLPGQYLPNYYMSSYVPSYYGLNSFYPASYGGYAPYGYNNLCNRYEYGVVYQVDCYTGLVQNVIPLYAGGYGVGQILPSAYNYYNVPLQYRSMYYPTADYSYWYAPGAIYQYSPQTSLITSVAALMSPGFTIGQPLPAGYGMYNVPLAYRSTYYDTADAWYRYNNGYIYQVNPATQLVTAVVASLLT